MLELKHVGYVAEDDTEILSDVSLSINERFVAITGPNGGGKSTLAKLISGIYMPTSGQILLDGIDITHMSITDRANLGICSCLKASVSDTISFGDSMNDIMMIRTTGISVAMANAEQRVKDEADIICESCNDDGVAKELERLGLI